MAAQSVKQADCVFGSFYRRLKSRLDKAQATVATAHAIARVVYRMLKYKVEYETISVTEYEKKYEEQQIKYMKKKAQKLGFQLIPAWRGGDLTKRRDVRRRACFAFNCLRDFAVFPHSTRWLCSDQRLVRSSQPLLDQDGFWERFVSHRSGHVEHFRFLLTVQYLIYKHLKTLPSFLFLIALPLPILTK